MNSMWELNLINEMEFDVKDGIQSLEMEKEWNSIYEMELNLQDEIRLTRCNSIWEMNFDL